MGLKKQLKKKLEGMYNSEKGTFIFPSSVEDLNTHYRVLSTLSPKERECGLWNESVFANYQRALGLIIESHYSFEDLLTRMGTEYLGQRLDTSAFLSFKLALTILHPITGKSCDC